MPDAKKSGMVTYTGERITLEIFVSPHSQSEDEMMDTMYGVVEGGLEVTLLKCIYLGPKHGGFPGVFASEHFQLASRTEEWLANVCVLGKHYLNEAVSSAVVNAACLWPLMDHKFSQLQFSLPGAEPVLADNNYSYVSSTPDCDVQVFDTVLHSLKWQEKLSFRHSNLALRFTKETSLLEAVELVNKALRFFSIFMSPPISINLFSFDVETLAGTYYAFTLQDRLGARDDDKVCVYNKFSNFSKYFSDLFLNYWSFDKDWSSAVNRFIASEQFQIHPEIDFLNIMPVLEGVSTKISARLGLKYVDDDEFKTIVDALDDVLSSITNNNEIKESIKNSLKFTNSPNFRKKLSKSIDTCCRDLQSEFCKSKKAFSNGLITNRNSLIHKTVIDSPYSVVELYWSYQKVRTLLRILIMREIGVSEDTILRGLRNSARHIGQKLVWSTVRE